MVIEDSDEPGYALVKEYSSTIRSYLLYQVASEHKRVRGFEYIVAARAIPDLIKAAKRSPHDKNVSLKGLTDPEVIRCIRDAVKGMTPSKIPSHYACLHLTETAPRHIVDAVYRVMAARLHPDAGGSHDEFVKLQEAYEKIKADIARRGDRPA